MESGIDFITLKSSHYYLIKSTYLAFAADPWTTQVSTARLNADIFFFFPTQSALPSRRVRIRGFNKPPDGKQSFRIPNRGFPTWDRKYSFRSAGCWIRRCESQVVEWKVIRMVFGWFSTALRAGAPQTPRCFQGSTVYGCNMTIDNVVALASLLLFALLTVLNH